MESLLARCAETVHRLHRPQESHGLHNDENVKSMTRDRKSTRLNSSHSQISYAVFCLKKKKFFIVLDLAAFRPLSSQTFWVTVSDRELRCSLQLRGRMECYDLSTIHMDVAFRYSFHR